MNIQIKMYRLWWIFERSAWDSKLANRDQWYHSSSVARWTPFITGEQCQSECGIFGYYNACRRDGIRKERHSIGSPRQKFQTYDLIFCGGQVQRNQKLPGYREKTEPSRLKVSQLVFALQHIKSGGTFVMLLHQADFHRSLKLIYEFHKFSSSVELFKPTVAHTFRSSFYFVAKGVNPQSVAALHAVNEWKEQWASCTLHGTLEELEIANDHEFRLAIVYCSGINCVVTIVLHSLIKLVK